MSGVHPNSRIGWRQTSRKDLNVGLKKLGFFASLLVSASLLVMVAAPVGAGQTFNTKVSISEKYPAFHGQVKSGSDACRIDREVSVYRIRYNQPDKLLGTTRTGPKGNWRFRVSLITSAYYAYAERKASASIGFSCRPARSRIVAAD